MTPPVSGAPRQISDLTYYIIASVVGAATGFLGSIFHMLVARAYGGARHLPDVLGLQGLPLYAVMGVLSAALICGSIALVRNFAPEASGSGVQEIEGAMQGLRTIRWARILPVKFLGGVMALGAGLVGGREGPTIHMGASIARGLGGLFTMGTRQARALWGAGGAAGLTAAFNAPIASVIFIIEEAREAFPYTFRAYGAVIIACTFSAVVTTMMTGTVPFMNLVEQHHMPAYFMPAFMVMGALLGVVGVVFNRAILIGLDISHSVSLKVSPYLLPALLGLIIGPLLVIFPAATGGGEGLAVAIANNPLPISILALVVLARFFMTAASYSVGAPAGIFAPILALATALGVLLASLLELVMPLPPGAVIAFAAAGMAGLFASTIRAPLVGVVLVVELTGVYALAIPALLASICSNIVASALGGRPIYEVLLERTLLLAGETLPQKDEEEPDYPENWPGR